MCWQGRWGVMWKPWVWGTHFQNSCEIWWITLKKGYDNFLGGITGMSLKMTLVIVSWSCHVHCPQEITWRSFFQAVLKTYKALGKHNSALFSRSLWTGTQVFVQVHLNRNILIIAGCEINGRGPTKDRSETRAMSASKPHQVKQGALRR